LRRHTRRKISVADNGHPVAGDNFFIFYRALSIAALFGRKINDHRSRLHRCDHILGPQLGRRAVRDQCGGDNNIHLRCKLTELGQLRLAKLIRLHAGITTGGGPVLLVLLEIQIDELGPHRFDLLSHFGAHIEGVGNCTQRG